MPDDDIIIKDRFASILDKTDWRDTIKNSLTNCVKSIAVPEDFIKNVKGAIKAVGATYPGWDAYDEVNENVNRITEKWEQKKIEFFLENKNYWFKKYLRRKTLLKIEYNKYEEVFDYLKNLTGSHRMLLYGLKQKTSGKQTYMPAKNKDEETEE